MAFADVPAAHERAQAAMETCKKTEEILTAAIAGSKSYIGVLLVSDNASRACFSPCGAGRC